MPKICLIHPHVKDVVSALHYLRLDGCGLESSLEWDSCRPDILIATEWIYYRKDLFKLFRTLYPYASLRVCCLQEAVEADMNLFDYACGFSDVARPDGRFFRLPSPLELYSGFLNGEKNNPIRSSDAALVELSGKTGFCNFLYSNPDAHPMRDRIFHKLCEYKKVDSLGKHLNNVSVPGTGYSGGHKAEGLELKRRYKFSVAAENACFTGYTSEKLLTSLQAHTVPVYWGNPNVASEVNPECFIDASSFPDLDSLLERVREIDCDDALWAKIISAPWFTREQMKLHELRTAAYREKMSGILAGGFPAALPEGYHENLYRKRFFSGDFPFERPSLLSQMAALMLTRRTSHN